MGQSARKAGKTEVGVQQIRSFWAGLDGRKQIIVILASLAMFAGVLGLSRMAAQPSFKLLYSGLESGAAGEVVAALEQRGVTYEVRGGAIYVESRNRDELRMTLASEGMPANGSRGYELLDSLTGFGTTSQMFDAAYWRAKEGELARTIVASNYVSQARVHIANGSSNPFQRAVDPTASVWVTASGSGISPTQAEALRYLIASAVAGLAIEDVAIIDANGNLIGSNQQSATPGTANTLTDVLRDRVQRLVEARVGAGNAVVEVSVDTVSQTETISERLLDPESRVAISVDSEENSDSSSNQSSDVYVASNLPDGEAASGNDSTSRTNTTRERVNYEVSETKREIRRGPGDIKRLTVAVLVNGATTADAGGVVGFEPRPDEELSALRDLVASAVGFEESRGDVITIKSMDLQSPEPQGTAARVSWIDWLNIDAMAIAQMAILAIVTLALGLFVVRPLLTRAPASALALQQLPPVEAAGLRSADALTGEIDDGSGNFAAANRPSSEALANTGDTALAVSDRAADNPVERLRSMIGERQEETVEILRGWLEEEKEGA